MRIKMRTFIATKSVGEQRIHQNSKRFRRTLLNRIGLMHKANGETTTDTRPRIRPTLGYLQAPTSFASDLAPELSIESKWSPW